MNLIIATGELLDSLTAIVDGRRAQLAHTRTRVIAAHGDTTNIDQRIERLDYAYEWILEQDEIRLSESGAVIIESESEPGTFHHVSDRLCPCRRFYYKHDCSHMVRAELVRAVLFHQRDLARRGGFRVFKKAKRKQSQPPVVFACERKDVMAVEWQTAQYEADELFA